MSQRSYTNERYRKDAKIGSTRKSAAKAKPVRQQGSAVSDKSKKAAEDRKAAEKKAARKEAWKLPSSPEIDNWRKVWWIALGLAIAAFAAGLYADRTGNGTLTRVSLGVELACVLVAVYIDTFVIRRLRKTLTEQQAAGKSSKHKPADGKDKS